MTSPFTSGNLLLPERLPLPSILAPDFSRVHAPSFNKKKPGYLSSGSPAVHPLLLRTRGFPPTNFSVFGFC
jgi:hypothetical protein